MKATITYKLSQVGQKASIIAGGNGQREQIIDVASDAAEFAAVVQAGDVQPDGTVRLAVTSYGHTEFDAPQTAGAILAYLAARTAKAMADAEARATAKTAATLATISERKTTNHRDTVTVRDAVLGITGTATVEYAAPNWPWHYDRDEAVFNSDAAKAFVAELHAAEQLARAEAKIRADADLAVKQAAYADKLARQAKAKADRDAWFVANGFDPSARRFEVESGALTRVPVYSCHSRSKNWMATIGVDPSAPGGLRRQFAAKAKGDSYYMLPALERGEAVEFGADDYSSRGRKSAERWYGYVVAVTAAYIVLMECATGKAAIKAGEKYAANIADAGRGAPDRRIVGVTGQPAA